MRLLTAGSLVRAQLGEPKREYIRKSVLSFFVLMSGTKQGVCVYGRGIGAKRRGYCITEAFLAFMKAKAPKKVNVMPKNQFPINNIRMPIAINIPLIP